MLLDLQQIKYARYDKHNDDGCPKLNLRTLASVVSVVADTRTDTGSNPSDYSHSPRQMFSSLQRDGRQSPNLSSVDYVDAKNKGS